MTRIEKILLLSCLAFLIWYFAITLCVPNSPCAMRFLTLCICVGAAIIFWCITTFCKDKIKNNILPIIIVCTGMFEALYGICQLVGWTHSANSRYLLTGTFLNPGPYGGFMAVVAVTVLTKCKNTAKWWMWLVALVLCSMVVASMSRGAILAVIVCAIIIWSKELRPYGKWLVAAGIVLALFLYLFKAPSANGRIIMAFMSVRAWQTSFWLGSGNGSFLNALSQAEIQWNGAHPSSWVATFCGVAEYPFCEPLKIVVEFGAMGLLLFMTMMVMALVNLWKKSVPSFFALLALSIFSLFSYPLSLWPFVLLLCLLIAQGLVLQHSNRGRCVYRVAALLLGISLIALTLPTLRSYIKARREYSLFTYVKSQAYIKDYFKLLPMMHEDSRFLFSFAQILRDAGRYNASNDMLRRCSLVSNDPMVLVLIGRNYEDMGEIFFAEHAFTEAWLMQPNRLYPIYRIMKMYRAQGNDGKAREYAKIVLSFKPKVFSPAVTEMKTEAKEILTP